MYNITTNQQTGGNYHGIFLDSKVKDIPENPAAAEILDKFCPGVKNPQMKLVGGLTLRKLASFPQSAYLQPHLEELDKELQAIE